jgi:molecular chaperone GrpE
VSDEQQPKAEEQIIEGVVEEASVESEAQESPTVDAVQAEIESLTDQLVGAQDQAVRAQAEAQNARRRAEQDVEKAHKFGLEKFVKDLLPVIDNLDRALSTLDRDDESQKPVIEGIDLTLKSFADTLAKYKVEAVDPAGEPFDPQLHQAMTMVPNPDLEPNTVMDVFQKGYTLYGRLVRPAMVVVSKAP